MRALTLLVLSSCGGLFVVPDADLRAQMESDGRSAGGDVDGLTDTDLHGDGPRGDDVPSFGDHTPGDTTPGDSACNACGTECCTGTDECVNGTCEPRCPTQRCATNGVCCPSDKPLCVYDRFCQAACPSPNDERCGDRGQLCCDSAGGLICGGSLTCVLDCPPNEALCGNGVEGTFGSTCCPAGDVCAFDACRTPTNECETFTDCANGYYCELVLDPPDCQLAGNCDTTGLCLPDDAPPDTDACQGHPTDLFEPVFDWHWLGLTEAAGCTSGQLCNWTACASYTAGTCYKNIMTSPAVADMDQVDEQELTWESPMSGKTTVFPAGRYPEVVVKAYSGGSSGDARIIILDGRTGETKRLIGGDRGGSGHPAIVNLDADPKLELLNLENTGITAYDPFYTAGGAETQTQWSLATGTLAHDFNGGAVTVADLNGDGQAEVVVNGAVIRGSTGALLADHGFIDADTNSDASISVIADVNLDGIPEVVGGDIAYAAIPGTPWTTTLVWNSPAVSAGWTGVANFVDNTVPPWSTLTPAGADPALDYPEVVVVQGGDVFILNGFDGSLMKGPDGVTNLSFDLFGSLGGPPNIADFDGDGRPEVSFAGFGCMVVVDVDCAVSAAARAATPLPAGCAIDPATVTRCTSGVGARVTDMVGILWMRRTQDESSARTGTSVFDFQGDGKAEVLYNDECFFRVFDGQTGAVVLETPNSSRTDSEYPIVVDVDGDHNSEIVVVANNDQSGTNRDCCFGASTATCPAGQRPTSPGKVSYWRSSTPSSPDNFGYLTSYQPSFCTCGHLASQESCDARSGCAWNASTSACGVFNCAGLNQTNCENTTGCAWSGSCAVMTCTGLAEQPCRDAVPCTWSGSACAVRPDRPDDPADICTTGTWGVWALGDRDGRWVQTLPQWHEHTYHVTDIDLDGNVVADYGPGQNNWEVYNNLRQNVQGYAPLNAPDLRIFSFTASLATCPDILLNARVVNRGRAGIPAGVPIVFYLVDPLNGTSTELATVPLPYALLPGLGADVRFSFTPPGIEPDNGWDFAVIANPADGAAPTFECLTDNNESSLVDICCICEGG